MNEALTVLQQDDGKAGRMKLVFVLGAIALFFYVAGIYTVMAS